jgi:hypothetical protein
MGMEAMSIGELDELLNVVTRRTSFFFEHEVRGYFGDEWVEDNPSFHEIYSISKVINTALEMRFELMEGDENGSIQEELDSLTGSDISVS